MTTISASSHPVAAVMHAVTGGRFRIRLSDPNAPPGRRRGDVLDDNGERIGDASDYIYAGAGFAVHTRPFAGCVAEEQVEFVP